MSRTQYNLWEVPEKQKFNFPGLCEKTVSDRLVTVQNPNPTIGNIEETPKKGRSSKKDTVGGSESKPKKEVKKKALGFVTGKVL